MFKRLSEYLMATAYQFFKTERKSLLKAIGRIPTQMLGSGTADNTTYLRGDGTWTTVSGGGGGVTSVNGDSGPAVVLDKSDIGLDNVDNTADSAKNVATAATLTTARDINGVSFNGSANITIPTIYSSNGTLAGARTVTMGGNSLTFSGTGSFAVADNGNLSGTFGSATNALYRGAATGTFELGSSAGGAASANVVRITNLMGANWTLTSGFINLLVLGGGSAGSFAPTTGTGTFTLASLAPTINQTGSASGTVRGIYYAPTLTSVLGSHIAYENTTGNNLLNTNSGNTIVGGSAQLGSAKLSIYGDVSFSSNSANLLSANGVTFSGTSASYISTNSAGTSTTSHNFRPQNNPTPTTGTSVIVRSNMTFAPTSGSANATMFFSEPVWNQTGTATGTVRGFYHNPVVTSVTGAHVAFENVSGDNRFNSTSGVTLIGSSTSATGNSKLQVTGDVEMPTSGTGVIFKDTMDGSRRRVTCVNGVLTVSSAL